MSKKPRLVCQTVAQIALTVWTYHGTGLPTSRHPDKVSRTYLPAPVWWSGKESNMKDHDEFVPSNSLRPTSPGQLPRPLIYWGMRKNDINLTWSKSSDMPMVSSIFSIFRSHSLASFAMDLQLKPWGFREFKCFVVPASSDPQHQQCCPIGRGAALPKHIASIEPAEAEHEPSPHEERRESS